MKELISHRFVSRRGFVRRGAVSAALAGLAAWALGRRSARAAEKNTNPFAYNVDRLKKTDPKWLHYEQTARFKVPREEARRLALGPEGRLYVSAGNYVCVLDTQGSRVTELAMPAPVRCTAVAADGAVYVSLRDHGEVFDA